MNRASSLFCPLVFALLLVTGTGCQLFHNLGTGAHMDAPPDHPHDGNVSRVRDMIVEVTTDAEGNVAQVHFQRSSGQEATDAYVAETIREGWPRQPSTKSVASLTYSSEKGFSTPKIISSAPVH